MDWINPWWLLFAPPALLLLGAWHRHSLVPLAPVRRRALLGVRSAAVGLTLLALAGPAIERAGDRETVIFIFDHSQSQGEQGLRQAHAAATRLAGALPARTRVGYLSAGAEPRVLRLPGRARRPPPIPFDRLEQGGHETDLAAAVNLARGLVPAGTAPRLVLVTDGLQTRGELTAAAAEAAHAGVVIDAVPIAGQARPDVRVASVQPSRARLHEGAELALRAEIESSLAGRGRVRLFENGIEVEARPLELQAGAARTLTFQRTPRQRNLYRYRVVVEGFEGDTLPRNNTGLAVVDVRGRPVLLHIEGEAGEGRYLAGAMAREGIRLVTRPASGLPRTLEQLAGYDGVIFSDVGAEQVPESTMRVLRDYVEQLGGGFLMIGGRRSFGAGGYYRTPIEQILPVRMESPDTEERGSVALALVIDRSGSMSSNRKIETAIDAAIASIELLEKKDYVGVVPFDSQARWLVPMTRLEHPQAVIRQVRTLAAGGGTNLRPGMEKAAAGLGGTGARVKHMIVLTDGQTSGSDYQTLARKLQAQGITISGVAIGRGADTQLMQRIAEAGGGTFYSTENVAELPRIFAEDTMVHANRVVREEPFQPRPVERHPMIKGLDFERAPDLLGHVRAHPKATAQVPLVTDEGAPLLAVWRFGLGQVSAFTSDSKSRWAALWLSGWQAAYQQFWAQVLRETAREPQGDLVDLALRERGDRIEAVVDLLSDPARYENEAEVEAEVFALPPGGGRMARVAALALEQVAPGRYAGRFPAREPGLYMVRARSGGRLVSAGLVRHPSSESATGRIHTALLETVTRRTGGALVAPGAPRLPARARRARTHLADGRPLLLQLLILTFLADLLLRRWEQVAAIRETLFDRAGRHRATSAEK